MSFQFSYNDLDETFSEEGVSEFDVRDSIIFLIDGTMPMFKDNAFLQCLETYRNIVRQKCANNRKDKMALIVFGTKESNCGLDNITVLQSFDTVTVDTLKNAQNMLKEGYDKYKPSTAEESKYPLYDALTHAFQMINMSKSNQKTRNIILLCTCNDNPCSDIPVERRRIEHLVATFKDNQTELRVVGLSDLWNDATYYKDLQIISGAFNNENYKSTCLEDFEQVIISPARSICRIPWKIGSIAIEVSAFNLISTPKYPSKIKLQKEDNEILEARRVLCEENLEDTESQNFREIKRDKKVITDSKIMYYKTFAGQNISFKPSECKVIKNLGLDPCIEVLAFKPIMCDPIYHCDPPYFVTYTAACNDDGKAFFMAFVSRCARKKVMPICKVITRSALLICMMIPSEDDGGFYMYKIPFNDKVRDLNYTLERCIYNSENQCPIDAKAVEICKKLMDMSKIEFDPRSFKNPKLERCIAHIEALALDERLSSLPPDSTLPPPIHKNADMLTEELLNMVELQGTKKRPSKQSKAADKKTKYDVRNIAEQKQLHSLNVADLKEFLKILNLSTTGTKSKLIDRIYEHLNLS